jgi:oxalate decarboxylase/phosphoglucose isomerase-like protein (cupin superfamily)
VIHLPLPGVAVDAQGRSFVNDVTAGDLWLFPGGIPHSIQGLGPDGAKFLLVFNDGDFNEFETFLLTDWFKHTPKEVLAKNFNVPQATFDNIPKRELIIQSGDVGYIKMSRPHYVENTGTEDLVFLEVFPIGTYQDISAAEWLAHTPARLVDQHIKTGEDFLNKIPKQEAVVTPI